ncbi:hypothetical protein HAX54_050397, partial [Datura stramonium]|nr:hypothetical protein [Datura stramonium]
MVAPAIDFPVIDAAAFPPLPNNNSGRESQKAIPNPPENYAQKMKDKEDESQVSPIKMKAVKVVNGEPIVR